VLQEVLIQPMSTSDDHEVFQIKKYQNRRYYDATRSRHVTLQEVHDLIVEGHDVCVTDSRTGDDITNLVLTQILLEKDQPKLDLFPSAVLHMMVRTNRNSLRATLERFLGPFMSIVATSQKQMDTYFRKAMQGQMMTPMDWTTSIMQALAKGRTGSANGEASERVPEPPSDDTELEALRSQLAALKQRLDELAAERGSTNGES
jgi:polyhydroxyalkanoate synthesis repressor PhaR